MYGEGARGEGREPGFKVVKKNEESETADDEPITDINVKDWEVGQHSTTIHTVCLTLYVLYCECTHSAVFELVSQT